MSVVSDAWVRLHYSLANTCIRLRLFGPAAAAYGRVLRILPADTNAKFQRAWCLAHAPGRRPEGIDGFRALLQVAPSASGFFLLGCALQQEGRHEEAVQAFEEATRIDATRMERSDHADLYWNLGFSLHILRRLQEAVDAYQIAAQLRPSHADTWANLGAVLCDLGRWGDAAPCQQRAWRLERSMERGLTLVWTLYELDRLDEAERIVRDMLILEPASTDAKECLVMVLTGQDRYDESLPLARALCASNPQASSAHLRLAGVLSESGRFDEALQEAHAAAGIAPADSIVHCYLGRIYLKMNDGAAALRAFERMAECLDVNAERLPASMWVWCTMGRGAALSLLRRHDEAMVAFEELLRVDGQFFQRWPEYASHYHVSSRQAAKHD